MEVHENIQLNTWISKKQENTIPSVFSYLQSYGQAYSTD
uniref:Uncharacterized protein n=1 Tax=Anguilla anguilla TaxID=7936 RepID=A0A0E9S0F4_ANGAN